MQIGPKAVLALWLDEVGPAGWYDPPSGLDVALARRFALAWRMARAGAADGWGGRPEGALALLILLDQFPRNMFRGTASAFASDARARALARVAVARGQDLRVGEPARQFFYLPFMHGETRADQDRCVALVARRLPRTGRDTLRHARVHRAIIRRFGRFPARNAALGRASTPEETAFLDGGYARLLAAL